MNMDQLNYFITIVEEGTISGAARRLHISQPPVSLQIRNLEEEYGVKLFDRGARQIRLTEAGKSLYAYALKIMELKNAAEDDLNDMSIGKKGSLKIGVISSGLCEEFFRGVQYFHYQYPDIHFKIEDGNTYQLIDSLEKHRIELAVIRTPFLSNGLEVNQLRKDPMAAIGQASYMEHLPEEIISLRDLENKPLILYRRWEKIIREAVENENFLANYYCINDDARTSLQWASAGLGIALVPASTLPLVPHLSYRMLSEENLSSTVYLVRRADNIPSESARAFFEVFKYTK